MVATAWTEPEAASASRGVVAEAPALKLQVSSRPDNGHIAVPASMTARELVHPMRAADPSAPHLCSDGHVLSCPKVFGGSIEPGSGEDKFTLAALGMTDGQVVSRTIGGYEYQGTDGRKR